MTPGQDAVQVVATPAAPKSGFLSSEFVVTLMGMGALAVPGIPAQYHPLLMAVAGLYVAARTVLKAVHALGYASSVPDLPALPAGSTVLTTSTTTVPK